MWPFGKKTLWVRFVCQRFECSAPSCSISFLRLVNKAKIPVKLTVVIQNQKFTPYVPQPSFICIRLLLAFLSGDLTQMTHSFCWLLDTCRMNSRLLSLTHLSFSSCTPCFSLNLRFDCSPDHACTQAVHCLLLLII